MLSEQNKELVRRLYEDTVSRKKAVITGKPKGKFTQYTSSARPSSLKAFNSFFNSVISAFPDFDITIESMTAKGDRVMVLYKLQGTHKYDFMGVPATNQYMTITCIDIFRLDNGKVVEHWDAAHQLSSQTLIQQNREISRPSDNWNTRSFNGSSKRQFELSIRQ